jgi:hypothetical protein
MSLTKAQLTTFASTMMHAQHDTTSFSQFFDDVMDQLGALDNPPFVDYAFEAIVDGTASYSYESTMLKPLYIYHGDELLSPVTQQDLEAYSQTWQTDEGTPIAYTIDEQNAETYRLYPKPDFDGSITGANLHAGYPTTALCLIFSEDRSTDIEDYYVLPVTFDCMAREFSIPSDHQDIPFADVCAELATMLYHLAGVDI